MSDVHNAPAPLANDPAARTETGEIKDQTQTQATPATPEAPKPPDTLAAAVTPAKPEAAPAVVPDKYELKVPEGQQLSKEVEEQITPVFKELGLTNDQAQKMFELHQAISKDAQEAPLKLYEKMRADWRSEVVADRQIGDGREGLSSGAKQDINAAIEAIGDQRLVTEFKEAMNLTGAGDNPAFLRAFAALGKQLREGTSVRGGNPVPVKAPGQARSAASAMYPNLPSNS